MLFKRLQTLVDQDARALVWIQTACACQLGPHTTTRGALRCRHQGAWVPVDAVPRRVRSQRLKSWLKRLTCPSEGVARPMAERIQRNVSTSIPYRELNSSAH